MTNKTKASPIEFAERIHSLDILRGFAVLGILVMNIQDYSMISAAYFNPTAFGDLTGANWFVWLISHIFCDQKFLGLFSLLFGAGIILFSNRVESKGLRPAFVHYRRIFWLILFGLFHAYCIWRGDILFSYGLCALIVYLFRRRSPKTLLILGLVGLSVGTALYLFSGLTIPFWPPEQVATMSEQMWMPKADKIALEIAAYTGGFSDQMTFRIPNAISIQTGAFFYFLLWRVSGLMFIGMALFKWRVLSAQLSNRFYSTLMIIGFAIGIPLIGFGVYQHSAHKWAFEYSFFLGSLYNYWGSLFVSAAYIGCIMLLVKSVQKKNLLAPLAATGRMAFTNYIMQSVICTFIFYGHGFGLFGSVERSVQILIVLAIWIVQIGLSWLWLTHFRFGPLEWLWRILTYWKLLPMRKS